MYLMLQQSEPEDYVIATGTSCALSEFVQTAFVAAGLDWREHLVTDVSLYRPTEIAVGKGNPAKAKQNLGWEAKYKMHDVVRMMVEARMGNV
jgi:GDPmannose 4,6-dehydratase